MTTPRARASRRQRLTRRSSVLYWRTVNRPGNWKQSSSKSCIALMLGSASRRRNTIGQTVRSVWIRSLPDCAEINCGLSRATADLDAGMVGVDGLVGVAEADVIEFAAT